MRLGIQKVEQQGSCTASASKLGAKAVMQNQVVRPGHRPRNLVEEERISPFRGKSPTKVFKSKTRMPPMREDKILELIKPTTDDNFANLNKFTGE